MILQNRTIYHGDNYEILKNIDSSSIDLIYLDPPFNKNKSFTAIDNSKAAGSSFNDVWGNGTDIHFEAKHEPFKAFIEHVSVAAPKGSEQYLAYMLIRLVEMHRILKDTGSIYLHCDPTMSHYLKLLLDVVFGNENFLNEIVWCYTGPTRNTRHYPRKHDLIFLYSKGNHIFNLDEIRMTYKKNLSSSPGGGNMFGDKNVLWIKAVRDYYLERGKIPEDWWDEYNHQMTTVARIVKENVGISYSKAFKVAGT